MALSKGRGVRLSELKDNHEDAFEECSCEGECLELRRRVAELENAREFMNEGTDGL